MINTDFSLKAWHIENLIDSEPDAQVGILAEEQEAVDYLVEKNKALEAKFEAASKVSPARIEPHHR